MFEEYYRDTFLLSVEQGEAIVGVESPEVEEWLTSRGRAPLANLPPGILGEKVDVKFEVLNL